MKKIEKIKAEIQKLYSYIEQVHPEYEEFVHIVSEFFLKKNPNVNLIINVGKREADCFVSFMSNAISEPIINMVYCENNPQIIIRNKNNNAVINLEEMRNIKIKSICADGCNRIEVEFDYLNHLFYQIVIIVR